ncbi:sperm acrosome-associated protein 5-like isoform X2 [Mixophyes fleayi]|uniref:sperm acrosome-associated protein 5-like isoform X2 n=1 Tax=Mixophyes fleayi TaxID=3061075 RepID=UPI003F4D7ACC
MKIIIVLVLTTLVVSSWAIDKCFLYRALKNAAIEDEKVSLLMCIAHHASGFKLYHRKSHQYHGIFQINDLQWCQGSRYKSQNLCNIPCSYLENLNLIDDIQCASKILSQQGPSAWGVWQLNCKDKDLTPYLRGC